MKETALQQEQESEMEEIAHGWVKVFRIIYDGLGGYVIPDGQSRELWAFDAARVIAGAIAATYRQRSQIHSMTDELHMAHHE